MKQLYDFEVVKGEGTKVDISTEHIDEVLYVKLDINSEEEMRFSPVDIIWYHDLIDIQSFWHPGSRRNRSLPVDWMGGISFKGTVNAPTAVFYSGDKMNRLSVSYSDALNSVNINMGVNEETGRIKCKITLFTEPSKKQKHYEGIIRIDCRDIPYYEAIKAASEWYEGMELYKPAYVPEHALMPMYSTWYSFHQELKDRDIEKQCEIAKEYGFKTVIVDDGWQTDDNNRGYTFCGDWEICSSKFGNMHEHVKRIHEMGMKYILWYSVPFIGFKSKTWDKFKDKILFNIDSLGAGVVDPRYPDVRGYLINIYESAVKDWDIDGLKLDFVDQFDLRRACNKALEEDDRRDTESVQEAVDLLLSSVIDRLKSLKSDIMIEFRQSYIGPCMRKYGNIFRATDCPNDAATNRIGTLDLRLFSGNTAVHSDMIMWSYNDRPESAALQFINILFSVPQFSMRFEKLPDKHLKISKFWTAFWIENSDVLLNGRLIPKSPEALYPLVIAENDKKRVFALYDEMYIKTGVNIPERLIIVNGAMTDEIYLVIEENIKGRMLQYDCCGDLVLCEQVDFQVGLTTLKIKKSGIIIIDLE